MTSRQKSAQLSRRKTPWDAAEERTPLENFIRDAIKDNYNLHHPELQNTDEHILINSYIPERCPFCGSIDIVRNGRNSNFVQYYKCKTCLFRFNPLTGTIFQDRKISILQWVEYCRNLFHFVSTNANSWNNKNAFTTSNYWMNKIFLLLNDYQASIVLSEKIWLDETYYPLMKSDLKKDDEGNNLCGLSSNQMCIGVICTMEQIVCIYEGNGKSNGDVTYQSFLHHIEPNSTLIHDKDKSHGLLVDELCLNNITYDASEIKKLDDELNPLNRINEVHNLLKKFLNVHSGFNRNFLQDYLNLFAFIMNPPSDKLDKIKILLDKAFFTKRVLKYRDFYAKKQR